MERIQASQRKRGQHGVVGTLCWKHSRQSNIRKSTATRTTNTIRTRNCRIHGRTSTSIHRIHYTPDSHIRCKEKRQGIRRHTVSSGILGSTCNLWVGNHIIRSIDSSWLFGDKRRQNQTQRTERKETVSSSRWE